MRVLNVDKNVGRGWECWMWMKMLDVNENAGWGWECWTWMKMLDVDENVGCELECWMWMKMLDVNENVGCGWECWTWMKMLDVDENVGCGWKCWTMDENVGCGLVKKPLQLLDNWSFFWISVQCFSFCSPSRFEQVQLVDRSVPRRSTWAEKHIIGLVRQLPVRLSYPQWCS